MKRRTERIFYSNPSIEELDATVLESIQKDGKHLLILDSTIFFPEGGGQPSDIGYVEIVSEGADRTAIEVLDVQEKDGDILHILGSGPALRPGDRLHLKIDSKRRRYHTQQHSGQHLLSAVLEREYGIHTVGFHLGRESCTIDISEPSLSEQQLIQIQARIETHIIGATPLTVHVCPPEEQARFPLRKAPPSGEEELRIVEIGAYDWVPCCGTHVDSCAGIRMVLILETERYKGKLRVHFISGDAAVALAIEKADTLARAAQLLGIAPEAIGKRIETLQASLANLETALAANMRETAILDVGIALSGNKPGILEFDRDGWGSERCHITAKEGVENGYPVIAVSRQESLVIVMKPRAMDMHLGKALSPLSSSSGGRGGGGPDNYRAVFPSLEVARAFAVEARRLLENP